MRLVWLVVVLASPCWGDATASHLGRDAHRRAASDRWLLYEDSPLTLDPVPPSHFRDDKYNHFTFHDDLAHHTVDRLPDVGLQSLFGPPNPDDDITKLDELSTKTRYAKKSNGDKNKSRSDKRPTGDVSNDLLWKKGLGDSISHDYPWNQSGDHWAGKGGGLSKLRRAGAAAGAGVGVGWSKRGGPQLPVSLASQLMLRSVRGNRQYDVPQIGECFFFSFNISPFECSELSAAAWLPIRRQFHPTSVGFQIGEKKAASGLKLFFREL